MGSLSFVFILACKMCISFFFISRKKKVELNILRRKSIWDMTLFFVTVMDEPLLCCWVPMSALSCVNNKYQIYWRAREEFSIESLRQLMMLNHLYFVAKWMRRRRRRRTGGEGREEKIENKTESGSQQPAVAYSNMTVRVTPNSSSQTSPQLADCSQSLCPSLPTSPALSGGRIK